MVKVTMALSSFLIPSYVLSLAFLAGCQEPRNITRYISETYVFIPCPFEPVIWRINGRDFISATLPPLYLWTPNGLIIKKVYACMDQSSFQCIDTPKNSLTGIRESDIGTLTVLPRESNNIMDSESCLNLNFSLDLPSPARIELDHQVTRFEMTNITLGWKIFPHQSACNVSRILSHPPCEQDNIILNITTFDTKITLSPENAYISNQLADFNLSTFSYQSSEECPALIDSIRINVTKTEIINLLLGNNNCSCVNIQCLGGLYAVVSSPDLEDALCPVYSRGSSCYSPSFCGQFQGTPFFRICQNPSESGCTYSICFENITEQLNGTKLDFFILTRTLCEEIIYITRTYISSFEIKVNSASADISIDTSSGEICFSSSSLNNCSLTRLTQYNVSVMDTTSNMIYHNDSIPESGCIVIQDLLLRSCELYTVVAQAYNDYIIYESVSRKIPSTGASSSDLCSCLLQTVQLDIQFMSASALQFIDYNCSTLYLSSLDIVITISINNTVLVHQNVISCSNGSGLLIFDQDLRTCNGQVSVCGHVTTGLNNATDCLLSCTRTVLPPCLQPTSQPDSVDDALVIIFGSLGLVLCVSTFPPVILLIIAIFIKRHKRKNYANINIPIQKNPAYEDVKLSRNAAYVPTRPVAASMHTQL